MDSRYYQEKRKREKEFSMTTRELQERQQEKEFFYIVLGVIIAVIMFFGSISVYSYFDSKNRKAEADSCENLGGKYMVVEKSGKTQIWGCVK